MSVLLRTAARASMEARPATVRATMAAAAATIALFLPACGSTARPPDKAEMRTVFEELTPVRLKNCTLKRYGVPNDGGYLMCENLMGQATAAYSYGIDGRDDWG